MGTFIQPMKLLIALTLITSLISCRKVIEYEISFRNQTEYRLDKIELSSRIEDLEVAVEPWGETRVYLSHKKGLGFISSSSIDFRIANYSDSTEYYSNTIGYTISVGKLHTDRLNIVTIKEDPDAMDALIFKHTINE